MSSVCVYSYADASADTRYVDDDVFNFTGTWSNSGTYSAARLDVAGYSSALYICVVDHVGINPRDLSDPPVWSILSLLYEYQCDGSVAPENALAAAAYALAQTGTNIAWSAFELAQIGTNTGTAAYNLAQTAYNLALSASSGTGGVAGAAYALAQIGTNVGTAAYNLAQAAQSTANGAFALAVAGTNAAAHALSTASAAWELAQIGTNTGTAAYNLAAAAYALAQIGTNAGGSDQPPGSGNATLGVQCPADDTTAAGWERYIFNGTTRYRPYWM